MDARALILPALLFAALVSPIAPLPRAAAATVNNESFVDVAPSDPDYDEIRILQSKGIIQGITATTFGPDLAVTRAELLKIALEGNAINAPELAPGQTFTFRDVTASHSLANYVQFGAARGYVRGYGDGTFRPNQAVTFAEATKILLKISNYTAYDPKAYFLSDTTLGGFMNIAAQQNLYERSFNEHRALLGTATKRRDMARAMAGILRWRAWKDAPSSTTLFTCNRASTLTDAQFSAYLGAAYPRNSDLVSGESAICVADQLRFGFAVLKGMENVNDVLVTFRTDSTNPILLTMGLNGNGCVVGEREGLDIPVTCDPSYVNADGSIRKPGIFTFTFNFVTGAQWISKGPA